MEQIVTQPRGQAFPIFVPEGKFPPPRDRRIYPAYHGGRLTKRRERDLGPATIVVDEIACGDDLHVDFGSSGSRLIMVLENVGGTCVIALPSNRTATGSSGPLSALPAGQKVTAEGTSLRFLKLLVVDFAGFVDDDIGMSDPRLMFEEPRLQQLCKLLVMETVEGAGDRCAYGESLVRALINLMQKVTIERDENISSQLAPWRMRKIRSFLMENLTDNVPITRLAEIAGLSRAHFSRAFKASFGSSPHRWVIEARIEEAKRHLFDGILSAAEISLAVGFLDQSHFTRTFSRLVGQSPRVWQNTVRNA